jgi:hypothetical protein
VAQGVGPEFKPQYGKKKEREAVPVLRQLLMRNTHYVTGQGKFQSPEDRQEPLLSLFYR